MLKAEAILFSTDMKHRFHWNVDNFKFIFLSRGQLGSQSIDNFFLTVMEMLPCYE